MITFEQNVKNTEGYTMVSMTGPTGANVNLGFDAHKLSKRNPFQFKTWDDVIGSDDVPLFISLKRVYQSETRRVYEYYEISTLEERRQLERERVEQDTARMLEWKRSALIHTMEGIRDDLERHVESLDFIVKRAQIAETDALRIMRADEMLNELRLLSFNLRTNLVIKYSRQLAAVAGIVD